jgi:hypothetical protein
MDLLMLRLVQLCLKVGKVGGKDIQFGIPQLQNSEYEIPTSHYHASLCINQQTIPPFPYSELPYIPSPL